LLVAQKIPTARAGSFTEKSRALIFLESLSCPVVVKADGLAGGKGVVIAESHAEAKKAIEEMMEGRVFGEAGARVLVERCSHLSLEAVEVRSLQLTCDGFELGQLIKKRQRLVQLHARRA